VAPYENKFEKAAAWYQSAAETQASAIAFWNLGWMYENGLGVPQVSRASARGYMNFGLIAHEDVHRIGILPRDTTIYAERPTQRLTCPSCSA
jgi:hypothetical protein